MQALRDGKSHPSYLPVCSLGNSLSGRMRKKKNVPRRLLDFKIGIWLLFFKFYFFHTFSLTLISGQGRIDFTVSLLSWRVVKGHSPRTWLSFSLWRRVYLLTLKKTPETWSRMNSVCMCAHIHFLYCRSKRCEIRGLPPGDSSLVECTVFRADVAVVMGCSVVSVVRRGGEGLHISSLIISSLSLRSLGLLWRRWASVHRLVEDAAHPHPPTPTFSWTLPHCAVFSLSQISLTYILKRISNRNNTGIILK